MHSQDKGEIVEQKLFDLASDSPGLQKAAHAWFVQQGPEVAPALADALEDARLGSTGHWRILRLLQHYAREETLPAVLKAFHRALAPYDPIVLPGAMEALAAFRAPAATDALIALLGESNLDIVKHAAALLGHTGDSNAVEPLVRLLGSDNPSLRYSATRGLIRLDSQSARAALDRHLESETDSEVRELIISARGDGAIKDDQ